MRLSITGTVFSMAFALFSGWCVVSFLEGKWEMLAYIVYLTLPFSIGTTYLCVGIQSVLGFSDVVVNWIMITLNSAVGILEFYFLGWLLERPFRR